MRYFVIVILTLLGLVSKSNSNDTVNEYTVVGFAQGTSYSIKYFSEHPILKNSIDSVFEIIDRSMSIYRDDSNISKFNQVNTRKIKLDRHLDAVLSESFRVYEETDGYFDITVMPLVNLWGFGSRQNIAIPTDQEVKRALSSVGMKYLAKKGDYLYKKKKGISIDVNGIAQGYTVDILVQFLESKGIENFIVELGGEIYAKGKKPNGEFVVEIQRPFSIKEQNNYKIKLNNKAVTSSGTYERKRVYGDKTISHHIDPKTGYPLESTIISATVIANSAIRADAIDNYLMALNPKEAISFIEKQDSMEAYLIYVENNVVKELASSGFNTYIYNKSTIN